MAILARSAVFSRATSLSRVFPNVLHTQRSGLSNTVLNTQRIGARRFTADTQDFQKSIDKLLNKIEYQSYMITQLENS